jgi:DNA uptake protein ComE-like DNA-binding protein
MIPSRVSEQAKAFDTTNDEVLEAGRAASEFTRKLLRKNFKVTTRWEDARGMTKGGRHYAFVETAEGEDLGELLVAAGWARSYGMKAATDSRSAARWQERYDRLEQKARRAGTGTWGDGKGAAVDLEEDGSGDESGEVDESEEGLAGGLMDSALGATSLSTRRSADREEPSSTPRPSPSPRPAVAKASPSPAGPAKAKTGKQKLDLNKASKEELMALPGIDEAKAAAIIAARPFAGSYDLLRVPGIGPSTLKEIYPHIEE